MMVKKRNSGSENTETADESNRRPRQSDLVSAGHPQAENPADINEQWRTEGSLRQSEERLHLAMESGKAGIWEWEVGREEVQWSQGVYRLLGYEPGALPSTRAAFRRCIHPEDRARHEQAMRQALEHCEDYFCEFRVIWADGSVHWIEARGQYAYVDDGNGMILRMRGVVSDIDRRKQAEEALRAKDAELELILTRTPFMLTRCTRDLHYRYVSRAYAEMIGRTPDHVAGQPILEIMGKEGFETIRPHVEAVLQGQPVEYEAPVLFQGVGSRFLRVTYVPDKDERGHVIGWIASIIDITERKQAEEALRESEEKYRYIVETATEGIVMVDANARVVFANDRWSEIFGYSLEEARQMTHFDMVFPEDVVQMTKRWESRKRGVKESYEFRFRRKDGRPVWTLIGVAPRLDPEGRFLGTLVMVTDITERRKAEETLRELNTTLESKVTQRTAELKHRTRQLQKLALETSEAEDRERERLAHILHDDLQQELAAAKFHLSIVRSRIKDDSSVQEITTTVDEMLKDAIAKSRSLSHELSPAVLHQDDFGRVLHWLADEMETKHGLAIHVQGQAHSSSDGLRAFLYRAAQELLFNVVKHAQVTEATVRVHQCTGYLGLSVSDRGRGFDPAQLQVTAGFGLLSIRERIDLIGGRMKIRSAPGRGSTFFVVVPDGVETRDAVGVYTVRNGRDRDEGGHGGPPLRVLIADDHQVVRQGLISLLSEDQTLQVVGEAANGQEAVDLAARLHPDVVVMDVLMPLMSGEEATRQIKDKLPQTRIVALTMHEESEVREKMCQAGAEGYVLKTASTEELLAAIRGESRTLSGVPRESTL